MMRRLPTLLLVFGCHPAWVDELAIEAVEANQAVGVPLWRDGVVTGPGDRLAPVLQKRDTWFLVSVAVPGDWEPRRLEAVLTLTDAEGTRWESYNDALIERSTRDWAEDPALGHRRDLYVDEWGGFVFGVEASVITPGLRWSLRVVEPGTHHGMASIPDHAEPVGVEDAWVEVDLDLVPLRISVPGCVGDPDVSDAALEPFVSHLRDRFPINEVRILRAPAVELPSLDSATVSTALGAQRERRGVPKWVYTQGFAEVCPGREDLIPTPVGRAFSAYPVAPDDYMSRLVLSYVTRNDQSVDEPFDYERYVFTHELAHTMGRPHAPCGTPDAPDPFYPYEGGLIGAWGVDPSTGRLHHPELSHDIMAYCWDQWVSPYTWNKLYNRYRTQGAQRALECPGGGCTWKREATGPVLFAALPDVGAARFALEPHGWLPGVPEARAGAELRARIDGAAWRANALASRDGDDELTLVVAPLPAELAGIEDLEVVVGPLRVRVPPEVFR